MVSGGEGLSHNHADVQEVVWVAKVFAEPLQRRVQGKLNAMNQHYIVCTHTHTHTHTWSKLGKCMVGGGIIYGTLELHLAFNIPS